MNWLADTLNGRAGWLMLHRVAGALVSRAVVGLAVSAFLLVNFEPVRERLGLSGLKTPPLLYVGALIFLLGYVITALRAPPDFQGKSDPIKIVAAMLVLKSETFVDGRRSELDGLRQQLGTNSPIDLPAAHLVLATQVCTQVAGLQGAQLIAAAPDIFLADVQLRQLDRPLSRALAWLTLGSGAVLLLIPTIDGVFQALCVVLGQA